MRPQFQATFAPPFGVIRIEGDLDFSARDGLTAAFESLEGRGISHVQADLAGVTFVDAYGLGLLRSLQRRLATHDGCLEVVAASDCFVVVCRLARYDTLLPAGHVLAHQSIVGDTPTGPITGPADSRR